MQVNMLEAKSQLSRLVRAAPGLKHFGALAAAHSELELAGLDSAFSPAAEAEVGRLMDA
jgi:hypothetical protein